MRVTPALGVRVSISGGTVARARMRTSQHCNRTLGALSICMELKPVRILCQMEQKGILERSQFG